MKKKSNNSRRTFLKKLGLSAAGATAISKVVAEAPGNFEYQITGMKKFPWML